LHITFAHTSFQLSGVILPHFVESPSEVTWEVNSAECTHL